ncbi:hypothetical protein M301_2636 [Methylotenera versatilis 301]|uniref:HNH endonuclease n=1 Tax=Methylotenera versatilis (strain 301) TaxID=666681 RepID=D7DNJ1_METV0|nr:hypothetical protein M301_2636 [Methylotenera versatilis 301]
MIRLLLFLLSLTVSSTSDARQVRSYQEKAEFVRHNPCPSTGKVKVRYGCKGYVIDHIDPLAYGGEDKAYNMQWQTKEEAKLKDKWERKNCH